MTYNDVITEYKKQLIDTANDLKNKMDIFNEENKDSKDFTAVYNEFRKTFDSELIVFDIKYNMSYPEILSNTPYKSITFVDSVQVYSDLISHYKNILKNIFDRFPPLGDSLEIEE